MRRHVPTYLLCELFRNSYVKQQKYPFYLAEAAKCNAE